MAAIGMMIAGAVANASAFIGGNAIFHAVDAQNAAEERKRHDLAIEKLQKQSAEWSRNRIKHIDYLNEQRQKKFQAKSDFKEMESSIMDFTERNPQPELSHFYQPSSEQKNYEKTYIAGSIIGSALLSKFI